MEYQIARHIGRRIRQTRWQDGVSHTDLAESIGVGADVLLSYEAGTVAPSAKTLHAIAEVQRVSVSLYFEGLKPETQQQLFSTKPK